MTFKNFFAHLTIIVGFIGLYFIYQLLPLCIHPSNSTSIIVIFNLHSIPIATTPPIPSSSFFIQNIKAAAGKSHLLTSVCKLVYDSTVHIV